LFAGNVDTRMNDHDNIFAFVQDSSFGYFFGQNTPGMAVLSGNSVRWLLKAGPKSMLVIKPVMQDKS
jgi:hypothetical protein